MTQSEARKLALAAAYKAGHTVPYPDDWRAAIDAYLATMADAGWRMVRDVGEATGAAEGELQRLYNEGWDDCLAAMKGDDAP